MEKKGVTLVELIVAVVILSITILVFIGSFTNITKSLIASKAKTLATNLAQEKIQILRQLPYYKILVTPLPKYYTEVSPAIPYDDRYFPPERILEGGMYFTRFTYVFPVKEVDGKLEPLPSGLPDQGMKCIQVSVVYDTAFGKKVVSLKTVESNPSIGPYRGLISGKVRDAKTLNSLKDVLVVIAENIGCRDYTNEDGDYSIKVPFGSYTIYATLRGYFPAIKSASVGANPQIVNFDLQPMEKGKIFGYVWINDKVVISQVVASTKTIEGFEQEYVELYNPTTFWWQMAINVSSGVVGLKYQSTSDTQAKIINLNYYTLSIPPQSYYLIANTQTILVSGITKTADAVFTSDNEGYPNIIKTFEDDPQSAGGGVGIYWISKNEWIDRVGWDWNESFKNAPIYEKDGIDRNTGVHEGEQFVRKTSTFGYVASWGNSYDSDNNNIDFIVYSTLQIPPHNSSDSFPPLTGKPAEGSVVSCNDGLSGVVVANLVGVPPVAEFTLLNVATGTWSVIISSNEKYIEINDINVEENITLGIPNQYTSPNWYSPYFYSQLFDVTENGAISGRVVNVFGNPLSGIKVLTSTSETYTNSLGMYFLLSSSGVFSVVANPNNLNPLYVSATRDNVLVESGRITSGIDFILPHGGRISGFATMDNVNPLAGVVFIAETEEGFVYREGVSDNNGIFYIENLQAQTYTIKPILSSKETSSPSKITVTVTAGATVNVGTFTITGSMGKISGKVYASGKPISSGVLIIASTTTITTPPVLSTATLTGACYFITSSYEDGSYILEVIGSSTTRYNVYAYYTTFSLDGVPIISRKELTNILVRQGEEVSNINFNW